MTDYISREEAIKAIVNLTSYHTAPEINTYVEATHYREGAWIGGVRDALIEIGDLPAADVRPVRWIPVTERLPEDFQKVLVFWREHSEPMIDTAFWQKDAKRFDGEHWVRLEEKITHWMPLPESPKEVPGHE